MVHEIVISDNKTLDIETGTDVFGRLDAMVETVRARTVDETIEAAAGADALIVDAGTPVTEDVLNTVDTLDVVGRAGIGVDNIDVVAAEANGVTVVNVPSYSIEEVSTHALSLLLACVRKVRLFDEQVKAGEWDWQAGRPMHRLCDQTLGLIAFGKITRRFAEKMRGFDMQLLAYDPYVSADEMEPYEVEKRDLEALFAQSDILSVHAPLTDETEHLLDQDAFDAMNDGVIVINTARGGIVDGDALSDALGDGTVAAAGLDVQEQEPPGDSPLFELQNVILTPHTAWYSEESRRELGRNVATDVVRVLRGTEPEARVDPDTGWY